MRIKDNGNSFTIWLSARDTYDWAHTPGSYWPCSSLADKRLVATFDTNGLLDFTVNGQQSHSDIWNDADFIDGTEFSALVADCAAKGIGKSHPCYFVAIGQFQG